MNKSIMAQLTDGTQDTVQEDQNLAKALALFLGPEYIITGTYCCSKD